MSIFSDNLLYFREKKHLTRAELAKRLNISPTSYGYYELGQREPKFSLIYEIAANLDTTAAALFTPQNTTATWAKEFKEIIDDSTGFLISNIAEDTISITRVNYTDKASKEKYRRLIQITPDNTLTFKTEDLKELYQYCTEAVGTQIFSNTMKSLFVQSGLSEAIIDAAAYAPGKSSESNFVEVRLANYPAIKGIPSSSDK